MKNVSSICQKFKRDPQRLSNIKPFISKYNLSRTKYQSKIDDNVNVRKNNSTIALNVLYIKEKEIHPTYISNSTPDKKKLS